MWTKTTQVRAAGEFDLSPSQPAFPSAVLTTAPVGTNWLIEKNNCGSVQPKEKSKVKCPHLSELTPRQGIVNVLGPILVVASIVLAPAALARGRDQVGE